MRDPGLNNMAWEKLFDKYQIMSVIDAKGFFDISATQIKEFREPRLMAKFDHSKNLPQIFAQNRLSILPITRGDYRIAHFDVYHVFETSVAPVTKMSLPAHIQSVDVKHIPSEAVALNCALAAGIIADFTEDTDIWGTVSGRMGSGSFSFCVSDMQSGGKQYVEVSNSQIEIDAAYEGTNYLTILEAKRDISDDFLVRQLYYPYRVWSDRVQKTVKPVFLVYSNGIYRLYEYAFSDPYDYNSVRLVKQKNYSIEDTSISMSDIQSVLRDSIVAAEPPIPFPQADKFERVINLCELLDVHDLSRADVTDCYDFDVRQTNYYTDAARYLGLLQKHKESGEIFYVISELGRQILHLDFKQRQLAFCRCIFSHRPFNLAFRLYLKKGEMPSGKELVRIMEESDLYGVESESTFIRRASSIKGWLNWIISLSEK